jgi:hypothetical protein
MPRTRPLNSPRIYQLNIILKHIAPPIWRRIQVAGDTTLGDLHCIVQAVMGWENDHLHVFQVGKVEYATLDGDQAVTSLSARDEWEAQVGKVLPAVGSKAQYEYDFGDSWEHDIVVEKILPAEEGKRLPVCLAGARACPPEDCGGPYSYASFASAIRDPKHPEYRIWREWFDRDFNPEAFDLDAINKRLHWSN